MAKLADEGQAAGQIATKDHGGANVPAHGVLGQNTVPATLTDLGITRQRLHEARKLEPVSEANFIEAAAAATGASPATAARALGEKAPAAALICSISMLLNLRSGENPLA